MNKLLLPYILIILSIFISAFSGCTKIDVPLDQNENEIISIISEKLSILDTEPVMITLENAKKPIKWSINSPFEGGYLTPNDGTKVIFSPPNVDNNCNIQLIAVDSNENKASLELSVIDEGAPPKPGDIFINEIGWAGTLKSSFDEYIEILNKTERDFFLNNWQIENAGGNGIPIVFSGYIKGGATFLIANYSYESNKSSIKIIPDFSTSKLALSNNKFGPYILKNFEEVVFDEVGDGKNYTYGINSEEIKASMARYSSNGELSQNWTPEDWFTEGVSINFKDSTLGTPGEINSNIPYTKKSNGEDANGIIIKYFVDAKDEVGDDWVQILITDYGDIKNFIVTDLDGSDSSITNNESFYFNKGDIITVVWGDNYSNMNNIFTIPDTNPTGTKDELVLLSSGNFLDGLCYYSTDEVQFDDEDTIKGYGWIGNPIHSKYGERKKLNGNYIKELNENAWNIDNKPSL